MPPKKKSEWPDTVIEADGPLKGRRIVLLDADVSSVFKTSAAVNDALHFLVQVSAAISRPAKRAKRK